VRGSRPALIRQATTLFGRRVTVGTRVQSRQDQARPGVITCCLSACALRVLRRPANTHSRVGVRGICGAAPQAFPTYWWSRPAIGKLHS
jgi:hypothetical protein